jgi:hypothetical protein
VSLQTGRQEAAIALAEEAAAIYRLQADQRGLGGALDQIGLVNQRAGRSREGSRLFPRSRDPVQRGRRPATRVTAVVLFCLPVVVVLSRLYLGMHYPSDVLAGVLMGGLWLVVVFTTLLPRQGTSLLRQGRGKRRAASPAVR